MTAWLRQLASLRPLVYATALAVAAFAFIVSYSHIYDLGREHAQSGVAGRLLPLSVDLLIVAASLVLLIQSRDRDPDQGLAKWLPRIVLWTGIAATVAANVAYGLPHGWLAAVISGWPGAAFVAIVEMVIIVVRPGAGPVPRQTVLDKVPSDVLEAAKARLRFALAHGFKVSDTELHDSFSLTRTQVTKARQDVLAESNGNGSHE